MVIYEVNLAIKKDIFDEYMNWLTPHIRQMLEFDGFIKANLLEDNESHQEENQITVSYLVENKAKLDSYLNEKASQMRGDGLTRFADKFTATRRVLQLKEYFEGA